MNVNELILQRRIEPHLLRIAKVLPPEYALTLVARYKTSKYKGADIVLTDDELPAAAKALARKAGQNGHQWSEVRAVPRPLFEAMVTCAAALLQDCRDMRSGDGWNLRDGIKPAVAVLRWAARLDWCFVAEEVARHRMGASVALQTRIKRVWRQRELAKRSLEWA